MLVTFAQFEREVILRARSATRSPTPGRREGHVDGWNGTSLGYEVRDASSSSTKPTQRVRSILKRFVQLKIGDDAGAGEQLVVLATQKRYGPPARQGVL